MATEWFVELAQGEVAGPFPERKIADDLLSGAIAEDLRVRQGKQGQWCSAKQVRQLFRQLAEGGWYVRSDEGSEFGPFTAEKLSDLICQEEISQESSFRKGTDGGWVDYQRAEELLGLDRVKSADLPQQDQGKWSTEPLRHQRFPLLGQLEAASLCAPFERLLLEESGSGPSPLVIARSDGIRVGAVGSEASERIFANVQRGFTHVCLFDGVANSVAHVIVIECPPGTTPKACQAYINRHCSK